MLLQELMLMKDRRKIVVYGFPDSPAHLQTWSEEVGNSIQLSAIFIGKVDDKVINSILD